jgi:hypothetical protein
MEARQSILENSSTEDNESFSAEQLVKHKEKELQTLVKIKEYTQEILGQLKFRVQTFEKYDTILADAVETIAHWREISRCSANILADKEYVKVPLEDKKQ